MSWWTELQSYGVELLEDLHQITLNIEHAVQELVAPEPQKTKALAGQADDEDWGLVAEARSTLGRLDDRYQHFVVREINPMFGQLRTKQFAELGESELSAHEANLNRRIGLGIVLLGATILSKLFFPVGVFITVPAAFLALVAPVFGMAKKALKERRITYHVLSSINVTVVYLGGYYIPAIFGSIFYYFGEKMLTATEDRSEKGLVAAFTKQPRTAWLLRNDVEIEVPFDQVMVGDVVVVNAGGFIPVDGTVFDGLASVDQQMLTGEAQPAEKAAGDAVFASTLVLTGKLRVRVDKAGTETVAAKIGEVLSRSASYQRALQSRGNKRADQAALPTMVLSGLALLTRGGEGAIAVLNSSFGISVRLSAPIAMLNLLNIASQNGILLKDGRSLELLSEVDTVVFDKTGTLTLSQPGVAQVHCSKHFSAENVLRLAAAAEHRQTHPIALAIIDEATRRKLQMPEIDSARYEVGYGIKVEIGQQKVQVGSERYLRQEGIAISQEFVDTQAACHAQAHSLVMVAVDGVLAGAIELQPTLRPEAESVVKALRARGLKTVIISGDQEEPTRHLAEKLNMDSYFASVLPEGKASLVQQFQNEGRSVCFIGDGINDSIALKTAHVSVSLRGATTIATDSAQVVLMQESLQQLPYLFELGDEMKRCLQLGLAAGVIPGSLNVIGVFFLGWGFAQAFVLSMAGLAGAMATGVYPLFKHQDELAAQKKASESAHV